MKRLNLSKKGKQALEFSGEKLCRSFLSGHLDTHDFVKAVDKLSYDADFFLPLKARLTPKDLNRVVEELAFIRRPVQGAEVFAHTAQQFSEFQSTKIILLKSNRPRKVNIGQLGTPYLAFKEDMKVHAEMMLLTYLLRSENACLEVFPYLGVSKKTCFLCGHILQANR